VAGTSPTQLTLKKLRSEGWTPWIVEHWNSFAKIRQDLFGFADIIAVNANSVGLIQCTTKSNMGARIKKINDNVISKLWLQGAGRWIEVWGWFKNKGRWEVKQEIISAI
jgi:hypothetical protein